MLRSFGALCTIAEVTRRNTIRSKWKISASSIWPNKNVQEAFHKMFCFKLDVHRLGCVCGGMMDY